MDLFNQEKIINILPFDGIADYHGLVMKQKEADEYLSRFLDTIAWKNDEAIIYGKHFVTKRKVAWYADAEYQYTYSNTTKQALLWTPQLLSLKSLAEELTGAKFNSCLLNLYHTGEEGMAWHSDNEKSLGKNSVIASFTLGAERKFYFKHKKSGQTVSQVLEHGSLLAMCGTTQANWLHRLPPTTKVNRPRVNLTFRWMLEGKC
jgi:alkylated DNA repair dioxygenase AlkB